MKNTYISIAFVLLCAVASSCKKETPTQAEPLTWPTATGHFTFTDYAPFASKPMLVYYHIPSQATVQSPVLFVFHGANRDAKESRDGLIAQANLLGFVLIVPEFSEANFPGGDGYNLGNIFIDGDNPSVGTLNPEDQWTFSVVDPIFNYFKNRSGSAAAHYDIFGFSAGAQVVQRMVIFKPEAKINRAIAASAGWYTMPDNAVDFPYGLKKSPAENQNLTQLFNASLTVMIGANDTDPNSFGLRHNAQADAQGLNRLVRAQYFYTESRQLAIIQGYNFKWSFQTLTNVGHEFLAASEAAVNRLYK